MMSHICQKFRSGAIGDVEGCHQDTCKAPQNRSEEHRARNIRQANGFLQQTDSDVLDPNEAQGATKDVESGHAVRKVPHSDYFLDFFKNPATQPKDRGTLVHGDFKIDNLVYHKTERRVIGILE